ncbi:ABC transporter permease [Dictyobacter kobayashii]|uniref:Multidrug ABC transporter permease n=1 Tax=Dictyobacter kobayashii TaxID=2014872 RepID=A0A402AXC3_9CHLR|nr:ABC transporter permease [Dictyobacter kobayashii]GCE23735.1 multidrug ABC transporter permease [Dictyobacter kobayashii]
MSVKLMREEQAASSLAIHGRRLWRVVVAEMLKQHRALFGSKMIYFSMLVWPAFELATAYYTFLPFVHAPGLRSHWPIAVDARSIILFFVTGMLGYTFFWSLVQSSWQFSWERYNGTLEMLFLTPANRLVLLLANGTAALLQSIWLFFTFSIALITIIGGMQLAYPAMLGVAFLALLIPAMAWAVFLNSCCIFARDGSFFYTILEPTMAFLSGVRIPLFAYPFWLRIMSFVLPLTTSLSVLRAVMLERATLVALWPQLLFLIAFSLALFVAAHWLLKRGEAHARHTGSLTLF